MNNLSGFSGQLGSLLGASGGVRQVIGLACLAAMLTQQAPIWALPSGYQATSGDVRFETPNSTTLNVYSNSNRAVVSYDSFHIGVGETVNFLLPNSGASILNQVLGGGMSTIAGIINSNGQVILNNPAGIFFSSSSQVNVGSLIASTLPLSVNSFLSGGPMLFQRSEGTTPGLVKNDGVITVERGGASPSVWRCG